ncbi:MAG: Asp-tRNA(Asn)/Glu-tRNA(Gln) amidotransferase subunit GatC [Bacteroidetes bacterium]|nr:MAG: Asp-tRNA(Asn)/Glu-tRNA(Gln) amidotransferase subunit GatC [Bacteroidota bacterium]
MHIDDQLISRLETLTRLKLSEEERTHVKKDLARILDMIDQLGTLDLDAVLPLTHITEVVNNWRADEVRGQVTREEALRNAPDTDGVFFRVPKVLPDKGA